MRNCVMTKAGVVILALLISACASTKKVEVKGYLTDRERVDQDLGGGNTGYLAGTNSPADQRKKTRKVFVLEVTKAPEGVDQKFYEYDYQTVKGQAVGTAAPAEVKITESVVVVDAVKKDESLESPLIVSENGSYREYVVLENDTLQKIAMKFYNSHKNWYKIYEFNKDVIPNPDRIKPGTKIKIPQL